MSSTPHRVTPTELVTLANQGLQVYGKALFDAKQSRATRNTLLHLGYGKVAGSGMKLSETLQSLGVASRAVGKATRESFVDNRAAQAQYSKAMTSLGATAPSRIVGGGKGPSGIDAAAVARFTKDTVLDTFHEVDKTRKANQACRADMVTMLENVREFPEARTRLQALFGRALTKMEAQEAQMVSRAVDWHRTVTSKLGDVKAATQLTIATEV